MRQILQTELDANFFRLGQAALKSFLKHNPDWEVHVCDIGLTDEQRNELSVIATIDRGDGQTGNRWPHAMARLISLAQLCALPDAVILHLDADTLTFGSVAPMIEQLQQSAGLVTMAPMGDRMYHWLCSFDSLSPFFTNLGDWYSHCAYNIGIMALKAAPELVEIIKHSAEKLEKHPELFRAAEQTALTAEILDAKAVVIDMPRRYNFFPQARSTGVALFNPPLLADGQEIVITHIPVPKNTIFSLDASRAEIGWWWEKWLDIYEEEPWPTHG